MTRERDLELETVECGRNRTVWRWRVLWGSRVVARLDYDREADAWTLHGRLWQLADRKRVWPTRTMNRPFADGGIMPPIWREIIYTVAGWAVDALLSSGDRAPTHLDHSPVLIAAALADDLKALAGQVACEVALAKTKAALHRAEHALQRLRRRIDSGEASG